MIIKGGKKRERELIDDLANFCVKKLMPRKKNLEVNISIKRNMIEDEGMFAGVIDTDDINTFDHVIKTLVKLCNHTNHQAEQCTYLIHYKGKCSVKEGNNQKLIKLKEQIREEGLNAIIK